MALISLSDLDILWSPWTASLPAWTWRDLFLSHCRGPAELARTGGVLKVEPVKTEKRWSQTWSRGYCTWALLPSFPGLLHSVLVAVPWLTINCLPLRVCHWPSQPGCISPWDSCGWVAVPADHLALTGSTCLPPTAPLFLMQERWLPATSRPAR